MLHSRRPCLLYTSLIFLDEVEEHEDNVAETLQVSADFTQTLAKSTAFPLILQAVSYTHLDVYKRQNQNTAGGRL